MMITNSLEYEVEDNASQYEVEDSASQYEDEQGYVNTPSVFPNTYHINRVFSVMSQIELVRHYIPNVATNIDYIEGLLHNLDTYIADSELYYEPFINRHPLLSVTINHAKQFAEFIRSDQDRGLQSVDNV